MSAAKALYGFEQPLAVDHCEDLDCLGSEFVDQSVTVEKSLAHVRISELWNDASELGMRGQLIGEIKQAFNDLLSVVDGVSTDVLGDTINVIKRLVRPDQGLSHLPRRSLACSWVR